MGVAMVIALAIGPEIWIACSTSLAVMVVTVTYDFKVGREAAS